MTYPFSGFLPSCHIEDPELLYGHNQPGALLDQLVMHVSTGTNTQLLGEPRSGKTSLMKCGMAKIAGTVPSLIQVYLNYREHYNVKGRTNALRFMLANVHAAAVAKGYFPQEDAVTVKGGVLPISSSPEEIYEKLCLIEQSFQIDGMLKEYVSGVMPMRSAGLVLYLDEYEHMLLKTFEAEAGAFFLLRDLSSISSRTVGAPKPLTIIIAGTMIWDRLCGKIGSPELNNIGAVSYLGPLDSAAFRGMWDYCLSHSSEDVAKRVNSTSISVEDAYLLTGGWPFYGKVVGEQLSIGRSAKDDFYQSLFQHFNVIWARLTEHEQQVIKTGSTSVAPTSVSRSLLQRGLIDVAEGDEVKPRGHLWAHYVSEHGIEPSAPTLQIPELFKPQKERLRHTIENISELIYIINRESQLSANRDLFLQTNQFFEIQRDLKALAVNEDRFSKFALAAYKLVFDCTAGMNGSGRTVALERLPRKFRRSRRIVRAIDSVRHHFGGAHVTDHPDFGVGGGAMPIDEILTTYMGNKNHPQGEQFAQLQFAIADELVVFLNDLHSYLVSAQAIQS